MANKNPKNQITKENRAQIPPRGRNKQTLILESIKERALLGLSSGSSREEAEKALFGFLADAAFNPTQDTAAVSNTCLNQLMKKGWPDIKSVMPTIEFELDQEGTPLDKASQILKAVADGHMPPDVANMLITSLASVLKIEEVTELKDKVEKLQSMMEKLIDES